MHRYFAVRAPVGPGKYGNDHRSKASKEADRVRRRLA
jgi:hypothetical protein